MAEGAATHKAQTGGHSAWIVSFGPVESRLDGYVVRVEANVRALTSLGFVVHVLEISKRSERKQPWPNVEIHPAFSSVVPERRIHGALDLAADLRGQFALLAGLLRYWRDMRAADLVLIEGGLLALGLLARLFAGRNRPAFVFDLHTIMSVVHRHGGEACTLECSFRRLVWRLLETFCIAGSDMTVACSREDALQINRGRTAVVPHVSLTGTRANTPAEDPDLIGFLGSGRLSPNRQAVEFIASKVLGHARMTSVRCRVIGERDGYQDIHERLAFVGFHDDIETALSPVSVCCAPMRETGGMSTKVLVYLMSGKRTVCTPEAARGIVPPPSGLWIVELGQFPETVAAALTNPWSPSRTRALRKWMVDHHGFAVSVQAWKAALASLDEVTHLG